MPPEGALMAPQNGMVDGAMMVHGNWTIILNVNYMTTVLVM